MKQKIGLFFGSFDPIHNGHIAIIKNSHFSKLDQIWFVITPQSPFKKGKIIASFHDRIAMVKIAISGTKKLKASDIECTLSPPHYTSNTLHFLVEKYPYYNFEIIMGSDNYISLSNDEWYKSNYILKNFRITVYPRGEEMITPNSLLTILDANLISMSSTDIRCSFTRLSQFIKHSYLPADVMNYIKKKNLYHLDNG